MEKSLTMSKIELNKSYNSSQITESNGKWTDFEGFQGSEVELFLKDKLEVQYADLKEVSNIFKHIIVFTNDRDEKNNKTLKNIVDAIAEFKKAKCEVIPELHVFVAADVDSKEDDSEWISYVKYCASSGIEKNSMGILQEASLEQYQNPYPVIYNKKRKS